MSRARDVASKNYYKPGEVIQKKWVATSTAYDVSDSSNFTTILTLPFTPRFSTSKILLSCDLQFGKRSTGELQFNHRFTRNGSPVTTQLSTNDAGAQYDIFRINTGIGWHSHIMYFGEDVPNSTSEITYGFQVIKQNAGGYDNIAINFFNRSKTALIIEEIAG
jgi:hypothetical protein